MTDTTRSAPAPSGIGGWLILPLVHLAVNGLVIAINAATGIGEGYGLMPPAGGAAPLPRDLNLLLLSISWFEAALLGYVVFCAIQLLRKTSRVPRLMTAFYGLLLAMAAGEYFLAGATLPPNAPPAAMAGAVKTVMGAVIAAAIWIPYFTMSKRVKNTFVR